MTVLALVATWVSGVSAQNRPAIPTGAALVFEHVTVIDVEHGARVRDQRVVIAGNRIRAMGSSGAVAVPQGARVVPARGKYLIPGLWDMHTHPGGDLPPSPSSYAGVDVVYRQLVANGITGIRDAGAAIPLDSFRLWKRQIAAGQRVGPRMLVSGPSIEFDSTDACPRDPQGHCQPRFHAYLARPEQAGRLVDSIAAAGADLIKLHIVPRPVWFAVAAEARRLGIAFGGHFQRNHDSLPRTVDGLVASDSGARILDHELWADVCGLGQDTVWSLPACAAVAAHLRRNHTWIALLEDPTADWWLELSVPASFIVHALSYTPARLNNPPPWLEGVGPWHPLSARERRQRPTATMWQAQVPDSMLHGPPCQRARLAYAADLPWVPGPDWPVGYHLPAVHLALLRPVLCGVPAWWALRAATLEPARALGLTDSLGTVAAGKVADLVLLDGDPLEDIWNVTKIAAVVANGRYFDRATLDRLLTEADVEWRRIVARKP